MTTFPDYPANGESFTEELPDMYVTWTYDNTVSSQWTQKRVMKTDVVFTDQVVDRSSGIPQSTVNVATAATTSATQQNVDEIQGTKSKGTWQFHGGVLPDDGVPAINQFWLADKEDQRTQEFCEATFVRIHALGSQKQVTRDRVELGSAVVGDKLIIQNLADTDGCSYTITSVEEHGPVDGDYTKAYALYGVEPDPVYCIGSVSPAEIVSIKLKSAPTEGSGGGDFLPLSGGSITGSLSVAGSLSSQGGVTTGELHVNKPNNNSIFDVTAEKVEYQKHATSIEQLAPKEIINVGILDNLMRDPGKWGYLKDYLPLAGGSMKGDIAMAGHRMTGLGAPKQDGHACTKGYVDERIDAIEIPGASLSTKDKMYLKGYYPFVINNNSQPEPGEITFKDYNYIVTQDPEKWKHVEYSAVSDAYGNGLEQQFMNHFDTRDLSEHRAQVWLCREDGRKFASWVGPIKLADNNFESRSSMTIENDAKMVGSKNYDLTTLRVDYGDILWIKCSYWG